MAETAGSYWESFYQKNEFKQGKAPSKFLVDMKHRLSKGETLDIGMGEGANAVYLAMQGFNVKGIDASKTAVERASSLAKDSGVSIDGKCQDMDMFILGMMQYDTIVMSHFRPGNSRYYAELVRALKQGGTLIVDSLMIQEMDEAISTEQSFKNYFFYPNELVGNFKDLHVLYYNEDVIDGRHRVQMLAKRPMDRDAAKYDLFEMASKGASKTKNKQLELAEQLFKKK